MTWYRTSLKCSLQLLVLILLSSPLMLNAQNSNEIIEDSLFDYSDRNVHFDLAFAFKTQNYFRGLLPSKAPTLATNAGVIWNNWVFSMYGGVGMDGVYQETDFILVYQKDWLNIRMEYYYNFTEGITDIPIPSGLFDFDKSTTRGLLDFIFDLSLDKNRQWELTSSTLIFGRDTKLEEQIVDGESVIIRTDQRYSQYFELGYNWKANRYKIEAFVGGSFSWEDPNCENFYGDKAGFNNVGIHIGRKFVINDKIKIPIKASSYINPLAETTYLILSVNLIQLGDI